MPQPISNPVGARDRSLPAGGLRAAGPALLAAVSMWLLAGCTTMAVTQLERARTEFSGVPPTIDIEVFRRAETERAARLAKQVDRLRADLRQAEEVLVAAESGLRESHSRADAVSNLAEARIHVERAAATAPWRPGEIDEARAKLEEAARQVEQGHFGAALFFVYRAERIADTLEGEAQKVYATPGTRFIDGQHVNLRAGPSTADPVLSVLSAGTPVFPESHDESWVLVRTAAGAVGWVHEHLLSTR